MQEKSENELELNKNIEFDKRIETSQLPKKHNGAIYLCHFLFGSIAMVVGLAASMGYHEEEYLPTIYTIYGIGIFFLIILPIITFFRENKRYKKLREKNSMALIQCPECGRKVSDKAKACPGCGYPIAELFINDNIEKSNPAVGDSEIESNQIVCPKCGYINEEGALFCGKCSYRITPVVKKSDYESSASKQAQLKTIILEIVHKYPQGEKIKMIRELRERTGMDLKDATDTIDGYLNSLKPSKIERTVQSPTRNTVSINNPYALRCPKCGSMRLEFIGQEVLGARDAKIKTTTSLNLNPLKPFTVFNHKQKVVKKAKSGTSYDRWHCADCGYIFEKRS